MGRMLDDRHVYHRIPALPSQSDSKTSILEDFEAYKLYYSTDRLPFKLPFRLWRFSILTVFILVLLLVVFVKSSRSGVAEVTSDVDTPRRNSHRPTKTLGGELECDPEVMKRSATVPDDVNKVRPADINVIAAMGDSLTAGFLSTNYDDDRSDIYPGNSFITGGDETLKEHITVANILRVFNPNIIGTSHGFGNNKTDLNVALNGANCMDIPRQAGELLVRMKSAGVSLSDDWKLISIFIGTNDIGELSCLFKEKPISRDVYKSKLEEGISLLRNNMNRTIVSIVSMWNTHMILDANSLIYRGVRRKCGIDYVIKRDDLCEEYRKVAYELQNERRFEYKDFTVVVQGFMNDIRDAFRNKDGKYDKSFYASDVIHLSKYGNAVIGKFFWNNLLEPVGKKTTKADLGNDSIPLKCPTKENPYIQTLGNSL